MRNLKKFLALVLAMMMAMSLMVTGNAATSGTQYNDVDGVTAEFKEAVDVLTGMGVFSGDNGAFKPASNVTRAEVAALIYRLVTGDVTDAQAKIYAKYGNFSDVREDAWYAGYVGYCANAGLIKGRPGNIFDPTGNVTGYEALAMILRAIGYDKNGEFTGTDWQVNVSSLSQQLGILNNIKTTHFGDILYQPARRDVVAELLFQADAYVPQVNYTPAFGYQQYGNVNGVLGSVVNETLGYKVFGLTWNNGVVVGNEVTGEDKGITKIGFSLKATTNANASGATNWEWVAGTDSVLTAAGSPSRIRIDNDLGIGPNNGSAYVYLSDRDYGSYEDMGFSGNDNGRTDTFIQGNRLPENVTRAFKWDSDLTLMDHAVKVWYDNRSGQYETVGSASLTGDKATGQYTTNLKTYALFDKVVATAVVALPEGTGDAGTRYDGMSNDADLTRRAAGEDTDLFAAATSTVNSVYNNWNAPGFKVREATFKVDKDPANNVTANAAYFNYAFGPTAAWNYGTSAAGNGTTANANSAVSPVRQNNTEVEWGLYLLISNTADKTLDVVIPLDMTMTKITQQNHTSEPLSVGVMSGNDTTGAGTDNANQYFDKEDSIQSSSTDVYSEIAQNNLRNTPVRSLNTKVAAIEITGTKGPNDRPYDQGGYDKGAGATGHYNDDLAAGHISKGLAEAAEENSVIRKGTVDAAASEYLDSTYYYQLTENTLKADYKVLLINPDNQDLTVQAADGSTKVLHQSVFAEDVDATFTTKMEGVHVADDGTYTRQLDLNRTYNFTLDEQGNYIYWDTAADTGNFVYGTYIDFQTELASGAFIYPMVYVDSNGNGKLVKNITSITDDISIEGEQYSATLSASAYDKMVLPKRDNRTDNAGGNNSGFAKGIYRGYALSDGGNVSTIGEFTIGAGQTETNAAASRNTNFFKASAGDFGEEAIEISKTDTDIGAKQVSTPDPNIEYMLSQNTIFYVVSGAGTASQKVDIYNGISELRDGGRGATTVTIDVTTATSKLLETATSGNSLLGTNDSGSGLVPYDMLYFKFLRQDYAQDYLGSAYEIEKVFIPLEALTWNVTSDTTMRFVGDNSLVNISSINGNTITQFRMYDNEGKEELVWINGYIYDDNCSAGVIEDLGNNVFYNLVPSGTAAVDGKPIYNIRPITEAASAGIIGRYFDVDGFDADTNTYTANASWSADLAADAGYAAATANSLVAYIDDNPGRDGKIYNVATATVVNLWTAQYPGVSDRPTLNNAGSLADNTSVLVSCFKTGTTVNVVFVNANDGTSGS